MFRGNRNRPVGRRQLRPIWKMQRRMTIHFLSEIDLRALSPPSRRLFLKIFRVGEER